jgi:hypothetical protein
MYSQPKIIHEEWKLNYFPPAGGKFSANIKADKKVISIKISNEKENQDIIIKKDEISSIKEESSPIIRSVIISVRGKTHKFSSYFMNTKRFINQIKTNSCNQNILKEKAIKF